MEEEPTFPVALRYEPPRGAAPSRVELLGEIGDWINPLLMKRGADGAFVASLELPVGVYAYKLRVDGEWMLDPSNPRTRASGGHRNNVLVVGGTEEPLLHAPASPYADEPDGGGLRVVLAVRKPIDATPTVQFCERGDEWSEARMKPSHEEDEHRIFEARLPTSSSRVRYRFVLPGSGADASTELVYERAPIAEGAPAWWRDAVVYAIYVDRFRPLRDHDAWSHDPGPNVTAGGHLEGIRRSLDDLEELGATALYLTPVHVGQSSHRYDFVDPFTVDLRLGGQPALEALIADAHARKMRVLLDVSFSHAGRDFPPCKDVLEKGRASRYAAWFLWDDGPAGSLRHYGRRTDAPLVDLDHPEVQALVLDAVDRWASLGVDGFRLDMAAEVPLPLARKIRRALRAKNPEAIVLGEVVPAHAWRWRRAGAVDASTDFGFHGAITDLAAHGTLTPRAAADRLRASDLARGGPDSAAVRFMSTHDHPRLATIARARDRASMIPLAWVVLLTAAGVPAILYGDEVGLAAPFLSADLENAWADRAPMPWSRDARDETTRALVRELLALRRGSDALRRGETSVLHADDALLVMRRAAHGDVIDVALNFGSEPASMEIADDEHPIAEALWSWRGARVDGERLELGPGAALVVRRRRDAESASARARIRLAPIARDEQFAAGRLDPSVLPTRIDFAVTERCNLRCQHCITFAPERTREGTARTLAPWVLDRLRGSLGQASYFGFVHGGESLAAPIFFDLLRAIRAARGAEPYVVHLLSNGVLLGDRVARELLELGVRSISVSLDGATAATNDAIRAGGRFSLVTENVRDLVRLRAATGADLRVGLSYVILQSNRDEVLPFVDLAASLGVDWLKLEEAVPVNEFSERSLLRASPAELADLVARARERAEAAGMVLVDHTIERAIWRCRLEHEPDVARFVAADEFANRSEIHPCRGPWEVACVEPNGDVRGGDFFGPVLGNVTQQSFEELWSSARAREERARSYAARLCGQGPVTCLNPSSQPPLPPRSLARRAP